jgi:hypothetical protein
MAMRVLFQKYEIKQAKLSKTAKNTKKFLIPALLLIFIFSLTVYFFTKNFQSALFVFMVLLFTFFSVVSYFNKKALEKNCREFALQVGYTYTSSAGIETIATPFAEMGDNPRITNVFGTSSFNCSVRIFEYTFTVGSGKHKYRVGSPMYAITLPVNAPNMIIVVKNGQSSWAVNLPISGLEDVNLEGNFNSFFAVKTTPENQSEIRVLLAPDIMAYLMDNTSNNSYIFIGNTLYVCYPDKIIAYLEGLASEEEYKKQVEQIEYVISKWLPSLALLHK